MRSMWIIVLFAALVSIPVYNIAWAAPGEVKTLVLHNGIDEITGEPTQVEICIDPDAVPAHVANHGDTVLGECARGGD